MGKFQLGVWDEARLRLIQLSFPCIKLTLYFNPYLTTICSLSVIENTTCNNCSRTKTQADYPLHIPESQNMARCRDRDVTITWELQLGLHILGNMWNREEIHTWKVREAKRNYSKCSPQWMIFVSVSNLAQGNVHPIFNKTANFQRKIHKQFGSSRNL